MDADILKASFLLGVLFIGIASGIRGERDDWRDCHNAGYSFDICYWTID